MEYTGDYYKKQKDRRKKKNAQRKKDKIRLSLEYGLRCYYCDHYFTLKNLTIDHIYPKALGGKDKYENYVLACAPCNNLKSNVVIAIEDFRKQMMGDEYYPFQPPIQGRIFTTITQPEELVIIKKKFTFKRLIIIIWEKIK